MIPITPHIVKAENDLLENGVARTLSNAFRHYSRRLFKRQKIRFRFLEWLDMHMHDDCSVDALRHLDAMLTVGKSSAFFMSHNLSRDQCYSNGKRITC